MSDRPLQEDNMTIDYLDNTQAHYPTGGVCNICGFGPTVTFKDERDHNRTIL